MHLKSVIPFEDDLCITKLSDLTDDTRLRTNSIICLLLDKSEHLISTVYWNCSEISFLSTLLCKNALSTTSIIKTKYRNTMDVHFLLHESVSSTESTSYIPMQVEQYYDINMVSCILETIHTSVSYKIVWEALIYTILGKGQDPTGQNHHQK